MACNLLLNLYVLPVLKLVSCLCLFIQGGSLIMNGHGRAGVVYYPHGGKTV